MLKFKNRDETTNLNGILKVRRRFLMIHHFADRRVHIHLFIMFDGLFNSIEY